MAHLSKNLKNYTPTGLTKTGIEKGGIYKLNNDLYMVKSMKALKTLSEYIGSNIARYFLGNTVPEVELITDDNGTIYTSSKFIKNFTSINDYFYKIEFFLKLLKSGVNINLLEECLYTGCIVRADGLLECLADDYDYEETAQFSTSNEYRIISKALGLMERDVVNKLVEHGDLNFFNIGIIEENREFKAATVDFSDSLGNAEPYSTENKLKVYNFDEYLNAVNKIISVPWADIAALIDKLFLEIEDINLPGINLKTEQTRITDFVHERYKLFIQEKFKILILKALQNQEFQTLNMSLQHIDTTLIDKTDTYITTYLLDTAVKLNNFDRVVALCSDNTIFHAIEYDMKELFIYLLKNGVSPTKADEQGCPLIFVAAAFNNLKIVEMLVKQYGIEVNSKAKQLHQHDDLLYYTIQHKSHDVAMMLVDLGAIITLDHIFLSIQANFDDLTYKAISLSTLDILNAKYYNTYLLCTAIQRKNGEIISLLLDKDIDTIIKCFNRPAVEFAEHYNQQHYFYEY